MRLAVVVQLDDLDRVEERGGDLGQAQQHDRRDGEVGGDDDVAGTLSGAGGLEGSEVVVAEPAGADHDVDPLGEQLRNGLARRGGHREVDHDIARRSSEGTEFRLHRQALDDVAGMVRAHRRYELEPVLTRDGGARRPAHPPAGPVHANADHGATLAHGSGERSPPDPA